MLLRRCDVRGGSLQQCCSGGVLLGGPADALPLTRERGLGRGRSGWSTRDAEQHQHQQQQQLTNGGRMSRSGGVSIAGGEIG